MIRTLFFLLLGSLTIAQNGLFAKEETKAEKDARMQWWREARFGLFIHWGLYAIPAGEWQGDKSHAEWIRTTAKIPLEEYDKFVQQFNPVKFNPADWVRMAKSAGMKYIVITSKHHDGFCLFDSKHTDFDVMSTPFKRDVLKELSEACRAEGLEMCWYHSIMDWHHPDYLPRRDWEKNRPAAGASFDRYVRHMKNQLKELVGNYGEIGVLWFDGEWESTWNGNYGTDLYHYVRSLQPDIIINNRVGAGRAGMAGMTKEGEFSGDFGTPEQEIPATGLPGIDWETCMTMNDHWGYNKHDDHWKSTEDLLHKLADIASKGGNFLLNVGPTAEGLFPQASIDRLQEIGQWMKVNGEAIYGTQASPFKQLDWGRCTQKSIAGGTRLYLHVFNWPNSGRLVVSGIANSAKTAFLLADAKKTPLTVTRLEDALVVNVPAAAPDRMNSVVVLDVAGKPVVIDPPKIFASMNTFVTAVEVTAASDDKSLEIRYTLDGSIPSTRSDLYRGPIRLTETTLVSARSFHDGKPVSQAAKMQFTQVKPRPAVQAENLSPGLGYAYFEGKCESVADLAHLKPVKKGAVKNFDLAQRKRDEDFAFEFSGWIRVPVDGVYGFYTESNDGSQLYIGDVLVVDNDRPHAMIERGGEIALAAGLHPIRVTFFQTGGSHGLNVFYKGPGVAKQLIPQESLFFRK